MMKKRSYRAHRAGGTALVEFALVAPLLLLLVAGVTNYGLALRTAISVTAVSHAGAQYGSRSPAAAADAAGIQAAALNAAPGLSGLTVYAVRACWCPGAQQVACTGSCGSDRMLIYTQVMAQATSSTIFNYAGLGFTGRTASMTQMRAQ